MPVPLHTTCKAQGCRSPSHGKLHCRRHALKEITVITPDQRAHMRSLCCSALCEAGKHHEYGNQYCGKCKEPCCWKA
ncbi:MAG: hypothetical protein V1926_05525 [Candidatus Peregrinibacteria bacterium]